MEYWGQGLYPGSRYLLSGIKCDKLSTTVAMVRAYSDKDEKDIDEVVTFLTKYVEKI